MARLNRYKSNYSIEKKQEPKKIPWITILNIVLILGLYIVLLRK